MKTLEPGSLTICLAIRHNKPAVHGACRYEPDTKTVFLYDAPIIRVLNQRGGLTDRLAIDLCGWGDTATTRRYINSILTRLNLPYRVGRYRKKNYIYKVKEDGSVEPIAEMPASGATTIPICETKEVQ